MTGKASRECSALLKIFSREMKKGTTTFNRRSLVLDFCSTLLYFYSFSFSIVFFMLSDKSLISLHIINGQFILFEEVTSLKCYFKEKINIGNIKNYKVHRKL